MKPSLPTLLVAGTLSALLSACGGLDGPSASNTSDMVVANGFANNGLANNGLANNGLANNGLANNGLANNGLANNGLANNGLKTQAFGNWFAADPAYADMVMRYTVRCAYANGSTLSYSVGGKTYSWPGLLGLAPNWSSGRTATEAEEQIITACMASLVNKYGLSVPVSLQGRSTTGVAIPLAPTELTDYAIREGCFFGNFFRNEGVFTGIDHTPYSQSYSTARACAFDRAAMGQVTDCDPIIFAGACSKICVKDGATAYKTCSYNGKAYAAITTRLQGSATYVCGDAVCEFTESCGSGSSYDNCKADCGVCL